MYMAPEDRVVIWYELCHKLVGQLIESFSIGIGPPVGEVSVLVELPALVVETRLFRAHCRSSEVVLGEYQVRHRVQQQL